MGANLFITVSIAVALEGSAFKTASTAGRKIASGAKKVLPKAAANVEPKLLNDLHRRSRRETCFTRHGKRFAKNNRETRMASKLGRTLDLLIFEIF